MKSIVLQEVLIKKYFLGCSPSSRFFWFEDEPLRIDSHSDTKGNVTSKKEHFEWEVVLETKSFTRELKPEEYIKLDDGDYQINKVSHQADGAILYYIKKQRAIEDEESKKKAESDFEKRQLILAERTRIQQIEQDNKDIDMYKILTTPQKKRWYQLW